MLVFGVVPVLIWKGPLVTPVLFLPLIIVTVPAAIWLGRRYGFGLATFWVGSRQAEYHHLRHILLRFSLFAILLVGVILIVFPERLFDLPRQATGFWLLLMLGYPILSVYPQEVLYRAFFLCRYKVLFADARLLLLVNALFFSWTHIVFNSTVSMLYTLIGGLFFAHTYYKTGSLRLVCLEHALYGDLLFSIGYGRDFLSMDVIERLNIL